MTDALETLIEQLRDEHANVRSQAALNLGKRREAGAVNALLHVLFNDDDLNVQEDATWALARIGEAAVPPLLQALSDSRPLARHNAVHTLGKIGSIQAVDGLIGALSDPDAKVRLKAAFALGQIGDVRAAEPLARVLTDENQDVRSTAAEALVRLGAAAVRPLSGALSHPDWTARELAAGILGEIRDQAVVEHLMTALHDEQ